MFSQVTCISTLKTSKFTHSMQVNLLIQTSKFTHSNEQIYSFQHLKIRYFFSNFFFGISERRSYVVATYENFSFTNCLSFSTASQSLVLVIIRELVLSAFLLDERPSKQRSSRHRVSVIKHFEIKLYL